MIKSDGDWPTLLGQGEAFVVGRPVEFDLTEVLKTAKKIQLATAFAHQGGWQHLRSGIIEGSASAALLSGLDFFQTEPRLLKEWLQLKLLEGNRIEPKLASDKTFFHPKVLIVSFDGQRPDFAIVGSGNLSEGGLHTNTECSVYIDDQDTVEALRSWFEKQFKAAVPLTGKEITEYDRAYRKNLKRRRELEKEERAVSGRLTKVGEGVLKEWNAALRKAREYFLSNPDFGRAYTSRKEAAPKILSALKSPEFKFGRADFDKFFAILPLGRLNAMNKDKIFRDASRIGKGLRTLIVDGEKALPDALDRGGRFYVPGFRLNAVTKVLAAHDPKTWPVFNSRVAQVLADFGYSAPRGVGPSRRYLAYKRVMDKFIKACKDEGCPDVDTFALDAFFYWWSEQLDSKKGA